MEDVFLILLGVAWVIGTPLIALVALVRTSRLRVQNEQLAADLALLRRQMAQASLSAPFAEEMPAEAMPAEALPIETVPVETVPVEAVAEALPPPFEPEPAVPVPAMAVAPVQAGWEQRLGARAFLWVGAVTLALAAIFLVRYSIEEGYLSPEVRVILAALFGFALVGGADRLRGRDARVA